MPEKIDIGNRFSRGDFWVDKATRIQNTHGGLRCDGIARRGLTGTDNRIGRYAAIRIASRFADGNNETEERGWSEASGAISDRVDPPIP